MGGFDLHDAFVSSYRVNNRSKKWWWPLFTHLIDSKIVNVWLIYHLHTPISLLLFRSAVAKSLMTTKTSVIDETPPAKKGRPSSDIPTSRLDGKMHYIAKGDSRRRCKVFQSQAVFFCSKFKQHLHEKCFKTFHGQ